MVGLVDHREDEHVVLQDHVGGLLLVGGGEDALLDRAHDVADGRLPRIEREIAQAELAHEAAGVVADENAGESLGVLEVGTQMVEGLLHVHVDPEAPDLGGHATARGVLAVLQEGAGELLLLLVEEADEFLPLSLTPDVLEDVDAVVVGHVLEDLALLGGFEDVEGALHQPLGELGKDVGEGFGPEGPHEEGALLVGIELLVGGGEVRVVHGFGDLEEGSPVPGRDRAAQLLQILGHLLRHGAG